ncbi:DUF3817 domain-containing protein [Kocuria varians]|uniref:DUF3817 domain-containing protein n=1 Tax=Kocuria varians TaxID=1272 RepID=UPI000838F2EE|nr:DUF3817 domain-containing protein [Kocuria varians]
MTDHTPQPDPHPRPVRRTDGVRVTAPQDASPERATVPDSVRAKAAALKPRRRFGGTEAQIRTALNVYKVCAWVSGTFLLLLVVEMITRYVFHYDLIAGGTDKATGATVALGWQNLDLENLAGGVNISTWVLIIHGWFYVVYVLSCLRVWSLMRWPFAQLIVMALGGVVPFLSFIVERKIHRSTEAELAANPKAAKRY